MLNFISFGSGSSGNCSLLYNEEEAIMIDAGVGIRTIKKFFNQYGINASKIKGILITHNHADHISSASCLSRYLNVNLFVSPLVFNKISQMRGRYKTDKNQMTIIESGFDFKIGDFLITPFKLPHDAADNFGYSIRFQSEVFTFMTDIGRPTDEVGQFVKKSNYLIIEADYDPELLAMNPKYDYQLKMRISNGYGHLSNYQTSQILFDNFHDNLSFIALCHLSQENNKPELARSIVRNKLAERNLYEGVDYKLAVLNRAQVSGPWVLSQNKNYENI